MDMKAKGKKTVDAEYELIAFKLHKQKHSELEEFAKALTVEKGIPQSPSMAARELMLEGLKRWKQKRE